MKKAVIGLLLITMVLGVSLTACSKNKSNDSGEMVLQKGEYVSQDEAAAMEKAEAKAAKQAAKEAEK